METEESRTYHAHIVKSSIFKKMESLRRSCGCVKTSEKLKQVLERFPSAPPPQPSVVTSTCSSDNTARKACISSHCNHALEDAAETSIGLPAPAPIPRKQSFTDESPKKETKSWQVVSELVSLVQLSVTATALALYYLIYCYMQLIYYTLRSALYFHNADGPMKITIGVVTVTSLVVGFNIIVRMERIVGFVFNK